MFVTAFDRDHQAVCESLKQLHLRTELLALGTALGFTYQTVQGMRKSGDNFLSLIVAAWLKQQHGVLTEPTWSALADKLEEIGHVEIATDIRRRGNGPQYGGESEQQDCNLPTPSMDASDSLMDNQPNSTSLSEQLDAPRSLDQATAPISVQPVTQSKPHTR